MRRREINFKKKLKNKEERNDMSERESFEQYRQAFVLEMQNKLKERFKEVDVSEGIPLDQVDAGLLHELYVFLSAVHKDGDFSDELKAEVDVSLQLQENGLSWGEDGKLCGMKEQDATSVEFSGNDKYGVSIGVDDFDAEVMEEEEAEKHERDLYMLLFNRYAEQDPEWFKRVGKQVLDAGLPLKPTLKDLYDQRMNEK